MAEPLELAQAILSDLKWWDDNEIFENSNISYDLSIGDMRLTLGAFVADRKRIAELEAENKHLTGVYDMATRGIEMLDARIKELEDELERLKGETDAER